MSNLSKNLNQKEINKLVLKLKSEKLLNDIYKNKKEIEKAIKNIEG